MTEWRGTVICPGHSRPIPDVSFSSITVDGYFLISGGLDKMPMLRNGVTGDWIGTFSGHKGAVWSARLDAAARLSATASADSTVKIWNAVNGDELLTFEHDRVVKVAIFSANSEFVYTGGADGVLRKFSLYSQGEPFLLSISGLKGSICAVVSIENGNFLWIASSENQSIYVWDARTNTLVGELFTDSEICSMEYSAARATVLVSTKNEIQLWDALNRSVIHRFAIPSLEIQCAALHPTKPIVAVGSFNELYARVYDLSGQELSCLKGHHGPVRSLAFSPADDVLATGSEDGTIRFWSMSSDR